MTTRRSLGILWSTLTSAQRRRLVALQFVSVIMATSTVLGLAAVMTFLAVLANPALIEAHAVLRGLSRLLDTTPRSFLLVLGSGILLLLIASAVTNVLGLRAMGRFAYSVGDRIREVLLAEYLRRDYLFHVRAGAGRLMHNVLYQSDRVAITLNSMQVLVTNAALTLLIVVSIAIVNFTVALLGGIAVACSYVLMYRTIRRRVGRNSALQLRHDTDRVATVEQALHGIKYLKVAQAQRWFRTRFANSATALSRALADTQLVAQFPRYILECLAGVGLLMCAAYVSGGSLDSTWLAQLTFVGFAGFRLLPAAQQMYHAFVVARSYRPAIEALAAELDGRQDACDPPLAKEPARPFARTLELAGVSFRYAPDAPLVLHNLSLRITRGSAVGIVGPSGCGKSTLVDLLLGLLTPLEGRVLCDGEVLDARGLPEWQRRIGYVPQDVIILDASVRENVAFGVDADEIDDARVREVLRQAGASEFVESLSGGYSARLSGVHGGLSGGQRQRIGLARALYHDPPVLVLDEATNALDAATELAIIDAVIRQRGTRTILIVAHGAAVIGACDRVYELRGGSLHERAPSVRATG